MSVSRLWRCQRCTFDNKPSDEKCQMCFHTGHNASDEQSKTETWQCRGCRAFNTVSVTQCACCKLHVNGKGEQRVKDSTSEKARWICQREHGSSLCGTINSIDESHCCQCQGRKPYFSSLVSDKQVEKDLDEAMADMETGSEPEKVAEDNLAPDPTVVSHDPVSEVTDDKLTTAQCSARPTPTAERRLMPTTDPPDAQSREDGAGGQDEDGGWERVGPTADDRPASGHDLHAVRLETEGLEFPEQECRLVLVGKTGNGKSHTGNTILGLKCFDHSPSFEGTTQHCQRFNNLRFGVRVEVVDTPGLFDTQLDAETVTTEIAKCFGILAPGPHAIVVVLRIGVRFTEEERLTVEKLDELFGVQLVRFLVIVFTHGNRLERRGGEGEEAALTRMLAASPEKLRELVKRVNHRYVIIDNTASEGEREGKVKALLQMVGRLLRVNGGGPYTSPLLSTVEQCMQQRERQLEDRVLGFRGERGEEGSGDNVNLMFRDMARGEVVTESSPLLAEVKAKLAPLLTPALQILAQLAMKKLFDRAVEEGSKCAIM